MRLRNFVQDCAASAPADEAARVREAVSLLQGRREVAAIEAMLACGAAESAVLALVGPQTAFMLSRGEGDACLATVVSPCETLEMTAQGSTLALAMLAAHLSAVVAALEGAPGRAAAREARHLH